MKSSTTEISPELTIREALGRFFALNQLDDDGGVSKDWAFIRLGPLSIPFPNFSSRKKAVIYHDVHHMLTGYPTTWQGEAEVGAWEVSTGCGSYSAAWLFDLGIFSIGLFIFPRAIFKAFIRGKRSRNFYDKSRPYEEILDMKIIDARAILDLNTINDAPATAKEILSFIGWWFMAFVFSYFVYVFPVMVVVHLIIHHGRLS